MQAQKSNPPKGMRDILPQEAALRREVTEKIVKVYEAFGFTPIETPAVEDIKLLTGGQGGENEKMIFKVLKRGEKLKLHKPELQEDDLVDFGLRFDLTVPLTRYYAQNRNALPTPFKAIQIGNVWRAERPQRGRFRQFVQCDIDLIGLPAPLAEIELIEATTTALQAVGFQGFTLRLNDRRLLTALATQCGFPEEAHGQVFISFDKLDKVGTEGVRDELAKEGFAEESIAQFLRIATQATEEKLSVEKLRELLPSADPQIFEELETVLAVIQPLAEGKFDFLLDLSLVRGMGYYTGMIFEVSAAGLGSSIAGGGRYDRMIGRFLKNEDVPACGFSIGFERILTLLQEQGVKASVGTEKIGLLYDKKNVDFPALLQLARQQRSEGKTVLLAEKRKNLNKQLNDLQAQGFTHFGQFKGTGEELVLKELS